MIVKPIAIINLTEKKTLACFSWNVLFSYMDTKTLVALFHYCLPFSNFLGQVIYLYKFDLVDLIETIT